MPGVPQARRLIFNDEEIGKGFNSMKWRVQPFVSMQQQGGLRGHGNDALVAAPVTNISEANGLNDAGAVVGQEDTVFPFV